MFFLSCHLAEKYAAQYVFGEVTDDLYLILWPFRLLIAVLSVIAAIALLSNTFGYIFSDSNICEKSE